MPLPVPLALALSVVLTGVTSAQVPWSGHPLLPGLGQAGAIATSADGTKVLVQAWSFASPAEASYRWTNNGGVEPIIPAPGWDRAVGEVMSRDGEVIAGRLGTSVAPGSGVFRWTAAGGAQEISAITALGFARLSQARISDDGTTLAATGTDAQGVRIPVLWSLQGGVTLPAATAPFAFQQTALSADGEVLAGRYLTPAGLERACRWSRTGGFQDLGSLGQPVLSYEPTVISADGTRIAGTTRLQSGGAEGFLWTASFGMRPLPRVAGLGWVDVRGMTPSGDTLVGAVGGLSFLPERAVRLRVGDSPDDLGPTNAGLLSVASSVSDDGNVVIGGDRFPIGFPVASWAWTPGTGFRRLEARFGTGAGALAVSADGRVVVGLDSQTFDVASSPTVALSWSLDAPDAPILPSTRESTWVQPSSTGMSARLRAQGTASVAANDVTLTVTNLPAGAPCLFINSASFAAVPIQNLGGGQGTLLLGGHIGRFVAPGQAMAASPFGAAWIPIDVGRLPASSGWLALQPGDSRAFQVWYRDTDGGNPTSNLSDAIELTFQ